MGPPEISTVRGELPILEELRVVEEPPDWAIDVARDLSKVEVLDSSPEERLPELSALEREVIDDGPEAAQAALMRLVASLGHSEVAWSEVAANYLSENGHKEVSALTEAFYFARWHGDYDTAEALLLPYRDETWAKAARLRLAIQRGRWHLIAAGVEDLLPAGVGPLLRVLLGPAREPGASRADRVKAYRLLVRVMRGRLKDPDFSRDLHGRWIGLGVYESSAAAATPPVGRGFLWRLRWEPIARRQGGVRVRRDRRRQELRR